MLWASQVAPGNENELKLRVYGDKAGLTWQQQQPNQLLVTRLGQEPRLISPGGPGAGEAAAQATRLPPGHPEGYLEAFANIYRDAAEVIAARLEGRDPDPLATFPTVEDGARGVKFIAAAVESSAKGGIWMDARLAL